MTLYYDGDNDCYSSDNDHCSSDNSYYYGGDDHFSTLAVIITTVLMTTIAMKMIPQLWIEIMTVIHIIVAPAYL